MRFLDNCSAMQDIFPLRCGRADYHLLGALTLTDNTFYLVFLQAKASKEEENA